MGSPRCCGDDLSVKCGGAPRVSLRAGCARKTPTFVSWEMNDDRSSSSAGAIVARILVRAPRTAHLSVAGNCLVSRLGLCRRLAHTRGSWGAGPGVQFVRGFIGFGEGVLP